MRHRACCAIHRVLDVKAIPAPVRFASPLAVLGKLGLPWQKPRTYVIRFGAGKAADCVRERIWSDRQEMKDLPDGNFALTLTPRSEPELIAWVRSFGKNAALVSGTTLDGDDNEGQATD